MRNRNLHINVDQHDALDRYELESIWSGLDGCHGDRRHGAPADAGVGHGAHGAGAMRPPNHFSGGSLLARLEGAR